MRRPSLRHAAVGLVVPVVATLLGAAPAAAAPTAAVPKAARGVSSVPSAAPAIERMERPLVKVRAGRNDTGRVIGAPARPTAPRALAATAPTATIEVDYYVDGVRATWPAGPQAAFASAVDVWRTKVVSPVPIRIAANWTNLGDPNLLGQAGPRVFFSDFPGQTAAGTFHPAPLANALAKSDLNGAEPEIVAEFNSGFGSWYTGTDGRVSLGQHDFKSVVVHELGHGLGFAGSFDGLDYYSDGSYGDSGAGYWGLAGDGAEPTVFDRFVVDPAGRSLLDTNLYPVGSQALGAALRAGQGALRWNGAAATAAAGGARPVLWAPNPYQPGSSISHLDEDLYPEGDPNGLMTPFLLDGEVAHTPGPIVLGMLRDMGWPAAAACATATGSPTDLFRAVTPARVASGVSIGAGTSVDLQVTGRGGVPASGVDAVLLSVEVVNPSADGSVAVLPGCSTSTASVQDLQAGVQRFGAAVTRVDPAGKVRVGLNGASGVVNVDVLGYFVPQTAGGTRYRALNPAWVNPYGTRVDAGRPVNVQVMGKAGVPTTYVDAVLVRVHVVPASGSGVATVSPAGIPTPTGTAAFRPGADGSTVVAVRPVYGSFRLAVSSGSAYVGLEVIGYFTSQGTGGQFYPLTAPRRITGTTAVSDVTVATGLPAGRKVLLHVSAGRPSASGHVAAGASGSSVMRVVVPTRAGQTISNLTVVPVGSDGKVRLRMSAGTAVLNAEVLGSFA